MQALLVVDIDYANGWTPEAIKKSQTRQIFVDALREKLWDARSLDALIVFITFPGDNSGQGYQPSLDSHEVCFICDAPKFLADFLEHEHESRFEPVFVKNDPSAFTNRNLAPYLRSRGVTEVFLAGCSTLACVLATAKGAIRAGFEVTLLERYVHPAFKNDAQKNRWLEDVRCGLASTLSQKVKIEA